MPAGAPPARLAVELAGHAYVWGQATAIEAERALSGADTTPLRFDIARHHVDGYLLILAVAQVLRCAEAMDEAVGGDEDLRRAREDFLASYPQARNMRDVLTHFDEYETGTGRLQRAGQVGELTIWLGAGTDSLTLHLASGLMVEVSDVSWAAATLTEATLETK